MGALVVPAERQIERAVEATGMQRFWIAPLSGQVGQRRSHCHSPVYKIGARSVREQPLPKKGLSQMLRIYGPPGGRTARALWTATELGLEYERIEIAAEDKPAFRAINPNARFPTIKDGDFILHESMAVTLYLAKTYGIGSLYPAAPTDEALALQWTFWGMTDLEPPLITCLRERVFKPEASRDPAAADAAEAQLQGPLAILDTALADNAFLLGDRFTIADLNVAAILSFAGRGGVGLDGFPHVDAWMKACRARPAATAFVAAWPI